MFPVSARRLLPLALPAALALLAGGCASTKKDDVDDGGSSTAATTTASVESAGIEGRPDIAEFCGDEPLQVAMVDGFSGNAWRRIVRAEFEDEAAKCDNIEKVQYLDAGGDPQKYISSIDGLVAQGVDVIVGTNDFGSATLAALRRAHQKGVAVVPYQADPGGTVGEDYTDFIQVDYRALVKDWLAWMNEELDGKGRIIFIGGPAGNPQDTKWLEAIKEELKRYPGITLARDTFLETKFDPASVQQAVAGAIGKYKDIDGYLSSYAASMTGAIRAYENAGKPMPPFAAVAGSNELGCVWATSDPKFEMLSMDGTPYVPRIALRKGLAAVNGLEDPEPASYRVQPVTDTQNGRDPKCNEALPPDADLSSTLTEEQLTALF